MPKAPPSLVQDNLETQFLARCSNPAKRVRGWARRQGRPGRRFRRQRGIVAFAKAVGYEIADTKIRVRCVGTGLIGADTIRDREPGAIQMMIDDPSTKRRGGAEEVAHCVAWLCPDASDFSAARLRHLGRAGATLNDWDRSNSSLKQCFHRTTRWEPVTTSTRGAANLRQAPARISQFPTILAKALSRNFKSAARVAATVRTLPRKRAPVFGFGRGAGYFFPNAPA
jgi:hypothetical protein